MQRPSGRPIISGHGSITERLSEFLDGHLRPYVTNLPSYIHDTMQLFKNIDELCIPSMLVLVAIDVEAPYSFIPHDKGLACLKHNIFQNSRFEEKDQ